MSVVGVVVVAKEDLRLCMAWRSKIREKRGRGEDLVEVGFYCREPSSYLLRLHARLSPLGYSSIGVTLSRAAVSLFDLPLTTFMQ